MSSLRVRIAVVVALLAGAAGGYAAAVAGWGPVGDDLARQARLAREQDDALTLARQTNAVLQAERDRREGERLVEFATRQGLERRVQSQDAELAATRDQLAFYEQLLPAGPPGTLAIRSATIEPNGSGLRYRVLLMRSGRPDDPTFSGRLQFVAVGEAGGEPKTIELEPLKAAESPASATTAAPAADTTAETTLALSIDRYQRSQGLLAVPDGFIPKEVTVNVLEGAVVRATRTLTLP